MLAAARKDLLLDRLRRDGRIVAEIAAELGLSEDSIRRDLRDLDAAGLAVRVYGGALPASPAVVDYAARTAVAPDSKRRVAAVAASLIEPGATVILDGGTTSLALVDARAPNPARSSPTAPRSPPPSSTTPSTSSSSAASCSSTPPSPAEPLPSKPPAASAPTSSSWASPASIPPPASPPATPTKPP
jgi:biotin operon repressor